MTASKESFRLLFNDSCRGMGLVNRGPVSRYELILQEPSRERWNEIAQHTNASPEAMNSFFQASKGNKDFLIQKTIECNHDLKLNQILAGEHFEFSLSFSNGNAASVRLLKLDASCCLVTKVVGSGLPAAGDLACVPETSSVRQCIKDAEVKSMRFLPPTDFHKTFDSSILHDYKRTKVSTSIMPLYNICLELITNARQIDITETRDLLDTISSFGISTYTVRTILDCLIV